MHTFVPEPKHIARLENRSSLVFLLKNAIFPQPSHYGGTSDTFAQVKTYFRSSSSSESLRPALITYTNRLGASFR